MSLAQIKLAALLCNMILKKKIVYKAILFCVILSAAIPYFSFAQNKKNSLQSGTWQGILHRSDNKNIAFNFTVAKEGNKPVLYIHNGSERLLVDSVRLSGDSLRIQMPFFASRFAIKIKDDGNLEGSYIKSYGARQMTMPFTATHGIGYRYQTTAKPLYNVSGKWQATFAGMDSLSALAIGEFTQNSKSIVTGTFRTSAGDYRYLEGNINGDSLLLSGFDGGHAILFAAKIKNATTLTNGMLYSGLTATEKWDAVKNNKAGLPDSYGITKMRPGETSLSFRFPSTDSNMVSITDDAYKGKVVIVQILGSWCPNCMDETSFLSQYYKENKQKGLEIIGLSYERTEDFTESKESLQPFRKRFAVDYPFLVTGVSVSDTLKTEKTLPQIDDIKVFPTTIFISKDGKVDKIHTGYDGPATGVHYEEFKKEFSEEVNKLLNE